VNLAMDTQQQALKKLARLINKRIRMKQQNGRLNGRDDDIRENSTITFHFNS
jgi:hypothetical protein